MLSYEQRLALGQAEYQDVLDTLTGAGLRAVFTETGGMNAALVVYLDDGWTVLITDADDSLSWARAEQEGWRALLYASEEAYNGKPVAAAITPESSTVSLLELLGQVLLLRQAAEWGERST